MVVDANKDAARECVLRAKEAMKSNDIGRMQKLLRKAKQLDPNCDVSSILSNGQVPESGQQQNNENYSHDDQYNSFDEAEALRNRKQRSKARSDSPGPSHSGTRPHRSPTRTYSTTTKADTSARTRSKSAGRSAEYTAEEKTDVERIRHCKDYYEILQIDKTEFTEIALKKKYRELALKLHPDKCKAPGSTEAFKALGNAYAVLSDPKKREDYDRYGSEEQRAATHRRRHHAHSDFYEFDVNRGFEAEMSPEDIFEMFFGGAFPSTSVHRRRAQFHYRQDQQQQQQREEPSLLYQLLQILPILIILLGGLLVQFFQSEPAYSLNRDSTYHVQRYTRDLRVPYFVKPDFEQHFRGKIPQVEQHVENEYVAHLRSQCYREKNNREGLLWTAMRSCGRGRRRWSWSTAGSWRSCTDEQYYGACGHGRVLELCGQSETKTTIFFFPLSSQPKCVFQSPPLACIPPKISINRK